jgi:hypothetical protein
LWTVARNRWILWIAGGFDLSAGRKQSVPGLRGLALGFFLSRLGFDATSTT